MSAYREVKHTLSFLQRLHYHCQCNYIIVWLFIGIGSLNEREREKSKKSGSLNRQIYIEKDCVGVA